MTTRRVNNAILLLAPLAAVLLSGASQAQAIVPGAGQAQVDCAALERTRMTPEQRRRCFGDVGDPGAGRVVFLPDLLADLFGDRQILGGNTAPDAGGRVAEDGTPLPTRRPSVSPRPPLRVAQATAIRPALPVRAIAGNHVPDEVLVTIGGDGADAEDLASAFGLELVSQRQSTLLRSTIVRFRIPDGRAVATVLAQLAGDARTRDRVPNHIYDLQQAATVVNYAFQRIALDMGTASGTDIRVAVIDSALDETHPALSGVVATSFDGLPDWKVETRDHATSVAGLIAGSGPFRGIAPGALIHHARAFEGGVSTMDILLQSLDWSTESGADIINMSFVGPRNDIFELACDTARELGIVLVAAAGNHGPGAPYGFPAAYDSVIAVTATDEKDALMAGANRGAYVFVAAPGVDMLAPIPDGIDVVTGTSFAAAIVSGVVANLLRETSDRSPAAVEKALAATARDLGHAGFDEDFGHGLVDARAAIELSR